MSYEILKKLAPLLKELSIGELEAVYDMAWDLKYALKKKDQDKLKALMLEVQQ